MEIPLGSLGAALVLALCTRWGPGSASMGGPLHFLIVDHALREEHGRAYDRTGRWVLAASVLMGWAVGTTTPLSEVAFARLFAVLAGGVVITSLKAEMNSLVLLSRTGGDRRKGRMAGPAGFIRPSSSVRPGPHRSRPHLETVSSRPCHYASRTTR